MARGPAREGGPGDPRAVRMNYDPQTAPLPYGTTSGDPYRNYPDDAPYPDDDPYPDDGGYTGHGDYPGGGYLPAGRTGGAAGGWSAGCWGSCWRW